MKSPKTLARDSDLLSIESYSLVSENLEDYLRLDLNENLAGCSPKVMTAIRNATVQDVSTYPSYSLVSKLITEVERIDQGQILITAGIDDGIRLVFEAFLSPGDKLLLVVPTFSMYRAYAEIRGVELVSVPFSSDFSYPFENVLETVSKEKPKILVVVNPNKPTGTFLSKTELEALVQQVRILSPRTLIVVDEAYREFAQIDLGFLAKDYENVLLMRTFSKSYGLAGLRIGYITANAVIVDFLRKLSPPFPVSKLACVAVQAAISDEEF